MLLLVPRALCKAPLPGCRAPSVHHRLRRCLPLVSTWVIARSPALARHQMPDPWPDASVAVTASTREVSMRGLECCQRPLGQRSSTVRALSLGSLVCCSPAVRCEQPLFLPEQPLSSVHVKHPRCHGHSGSLGGSRPLLPGVLIRAPCSALDGNRSPLAGVPAPRLLVIPIAPRLSNIHGDDRRCPTTACSTHHAQRMSEG